MDDAQARALARSADPAIAARGRAALCRLAGHAWHRAGLTESGEIVLTFSSSEPLLLTPWAWCESCGKATCCPEHPEMDAFRHPWPPLGLRPPHPAHRVRWRGT